MPHWERRLPAKYIVVATAKSILIDVEIELTDTAIKCCTQALVDCGADGSFINSGYAHANDIPTRKLTCPILVFNVNGSPNEGGSISKTVDVILQYDGHSERMSLAVTN